MHRSFGLHGAFQAALNLDRFELSLKKAGSRTFEQSLEEPLDRGEGTSHRVGESTSRGGSGLDFTHGADAHQYLPTWTIARSYRYWSKGSLWPKVPAHCADMVGFEMFCERCGKRYGNGEASGSTSLPLSKRLLKAVGVSASAPHASTEEPLLRFCLACRGYSCAECWNDDAGFCQTCVPVEVPMVEAPVIDIPALEMPAPRVAPQMSFETSDDMPPYLAMLAANDGVPPVDPLADFAAEPEAEPELAAFAEPDLEALTEATLEATPTLEAPTEAESEPVAAFAAESEPQPVAVEALAAEELVVDEAPAEEIVVAAETLAMDERPMELLFSEEEMAAEPEPEAAWDWAFVGVTEAETTAEPVAAFAEDAVPTESGTLVDAPVVPGQPQILPPPVYRPLPPLGPIVPPPPPAAAGPRPTIDFDILEPPPAFVIAPPQAQALMRPQLPAGLFEGPGPQIRPCHQCELPVSAKARFCRRCGSAQP